MNTRGDQEISGTYNAAVIETMWPLDSMADASHLILIVVTLGEESSFCAFESPLHGVRLLCAIFLVIIRNSNYNN